MSALSTWQFSTTQARRFRWRSFQKSSKMCPKPFSDLKSFDRVRSFHTPSSLWPRLRFKLFKVKGRFNESSIVRSLLIKSRLFLILVSITLRKNYATVNFHQLLKLKAPKSNKPHLATSRTLHDTILIILALNCIFTRPIFASYLINIV